jgi:hypothetical protein
VYQYNISVIIQENAVVEDEQLAPPRPTKPRGALMMDLKGTQDFHRD